jgi:hypothetical protein
MLGQEETEEFWRAGKRSIGVKGFVPVWERTQPPRLEMTDQIRDKSLDELEDMMAGFSREHLPDAITANPVDRDRDRDQDHTVASAPGLLRERNRGVLDGSAVSSDGGSVYVPSVSEG